MIEIASLDTEPSPIPASGSLEGSVEKITVLSGSSRGIRYEIVTGDEKTYRLTFQPFEPSLNVFEKGDQVKVVLFNLQENGKVKSIVLSSTDQEKILLIDLGDFITLTGYGIHFDVTPSSKTEYLESGRWENYCFAAYRHYSLSIDMGEKVDFLKPGETKTFEKGDYIYTVTNLDNASLETSECGGDMAAKSTGYIVSGLQTSPLSQ